MSSITQLGKASGESIKDSVVDITGPFDAVQARGSVDYMLRTVQQNNVQFTLLADQKANIVLGVGSIIVTLTVGRVAVGQPTLSMVLLAGCTFGAALCALAALLPKVAKGCAPDADGHAVNPLFFGACQQLPEDIFMRRMASVMSDDATV